MRTSNTVSPLRREISRFPYKERLHMPGSPTTPDRQSARNDALRRIAFRVVQRVCIRKNNLFVAQWLAYAPPFRRFTCSLANTSARLGADAGRYAFIVVDFHHILPAG